MSYYFMELILILILILRIVTLFLDRDSLFIALFIQMLYFFKF
jgi:hypothetical protein